MFHILLLVASVFERALLAPCSPLFARERSLDDVVGYSRDEDLSPMGQVKVVCVYPLRRLMSLFGILGS